MQITLHIKKKFIKKNDFNIIKEHFSKFSLSNKIKKIVKKNNLISIINYMKTDKKNYNNKINLILLNRIGSAKINNTYKTSEINSFLSDLLIYK